MVDWLLQAVDSSLLYMNCFLFIPCSLLPNEGSFTIVSASLSLFLPFYKPLRIKRKDKVDKDLV